MRLCKELIILYSLLVSLGHSLSSSTESFSSQNITSFHESSAPEANRAAPEIHENGFTVSGKCRENNRRVHVYWKSADVQGGREHLGYGIENTNITKPSEHREITLCVTKERTELSIYAFSNVAQSSKSSTTIVIPANNQMSTGILKPCNIRVEYLTNINRVFIDWSSLQVSKPTKYTLFWCLHLHNVCQSELNWLDVNPDSLNKQVLTLDYHPTSYKYGVSLNQNGSLCSELKDADFQVSLFNDSHVQVEITPNCSSLVGVDINYCIRLDQHDKCYGEIFTRKDATQLCSKLIYLELKSEENYMLWLSLNYASHGHKESELKYIISINKAVNKLAAVIGVVIGAVILVIIVFIIGLVCYGKLMIDNKQRMWRKTSGISFEKQEEETMLQSSSDL
ncbi:hypothetical protein EB796_011124 [Bugula neritina]|uniref:Uncharacterized protein n=1 Tax=Bugula neritina TaxID=10212 RepID=A0A7J7JX94_BUGNE|nr:hypothetical protein EB796_011124 [Bugula neritina]